MEIKEVQKDVLTIEEAAKYLGFKVNTLRTYVCARVIPHYRARSGKLYFKLDELKDFALAERVPSKYEEESKAEVRSLAK